MDSHAEPSRPGSSTVALAFVRTSRDHLIGEYVPKILRCLAALETEDIWWRPNPASNAVGNLVLHLCGNARQWILHGIVGEPDIRTRDREFATTDALGSASLTEHLSDWTVAIEGGFQAISEHCERDPDYLATHRVIQGLNVTVLEALYHVVEHFAQHTGQIIYVTKLRTGSDLGFWEVQAGVATPKW